MAKVYSPNKQYTGISANISFENGVGIVNDPHLFQWFELHGYTVVEDFEEENSVKDEVESNEVKNNISDEIDYDSIPYKELKKIASEKGVNSYGKKKDEIIYELKKLELGKDDTNHV